MDSSQYYDPTSNSVVTWQSLVSNLVDSLKIGSNLVIDWGLDIEAMNVPPTRVHSSMRFVPPTSYSK